MPLVIVAIGVALLLLLMIRFKMNGFIALVLVALAVGLMQGMPLDKVIVSIKTALAAPWQPRADHGLRRYAR
jgi:Gnt-I system high-affinity gluconate transporter